MLKNVTTTENGIEKTINLLDDYNVDTIDENGDRLLHWVIKSGNIENTMQSISADNIATLNNAPETDKEKIARLTNEIATLKYDNEQLTTNMDSLIKQHNDISKSSNALEIAFDEIRNFLLDKNASLETENKSLRGENGLYEGMDIIHEAIKIAFIVGNIKITNLETQVKQLQKVSDEPKTAPDKNSPNPKKRYLSLNDLEEGPSSKVGKSSIEPTQTDNKQL